MNAMEWFHEPMTDRLRGVQTILFSIRCYVAPSEPMMDRLRKILLNRCHLAPNDLGIHPYSETALLSKHSSYVECTVKVTLGLNPTINITVEESGTATVESHYKSFHQCLCRLL
jgi:hypothetical protein